MAQDPQAHARAYGLSRSVAKDIEDEEGPPPGGHGGETNTRPRNPASESNHGPKTLKALRDQASPNSGRRR